MKVSLVEEIRYTKKGKKTIYDYVVLNSDGGEIFKSLNREFAVEVCNKFGFEIVYTDANFKVGDNVKYSIDNNVFTGTISKINDSNYVTVIFNLGCNKSEVKLPISQITLNP